MSSPALSQPRPSLLSQAFSTCRNGFVAVLVFSLCINVLMLTAPLYMMQVFDRVLSSRSGDTLVLLLLIATLALGVMGALDAVRTFLMNRMGAWMDGHLSGAVLGEAVMGYLRRGGSPTVQGLRDLSTVRSFLTGAGVFPILDAPWAPIFIVVIFMLNPWLGVLSLVGAIALFALALANELVTREALKRAGGAAQAAMSDAETAVRNADVVEAMGMMPAMLARWHKKNAEAIALQSVAGDKGGGISAVSKFLRLLLQIAVLTLGAWLVPLGDKLIIDARVDPGDIDVVRPGLEARVRLTAFQQRKIVPLKGVVDSVSADRFTDEKTGIPYFRARVVITEDPAKVMKASPLYPGMQAELLIVTGSRTVLEYIFQPLFQSFNRAFRET